MTVDPRYVADLSDIAGIRIECVDCGASESRPPAKAKDMMPLHCPNCGVQWFVPNSSDKTSAEALIRIIRAFATAPTAKCKIRLEMTAPK